MGAPSRKVRLGIRQRLDLGADADRPRRPPRRDRQMGLRRHLPEARDALGRAVIRQAVTYAMRILGRQFVLGRTIAEALKEAKPLADKGYRFSFDMLGEAAYTRADAARYAKSYRDALDVVAAMNPKDRRSIFERPSLSVKLSALHPRYEWVKRERVFAELLPVVVDLAARARAADIAITIDAEEADRLDLMLDLFEAFGATQDLAGWNGLGLAVQAYQKRAVPV